MVSIIAKFFNCVKCSHDAFFNLDSERPFHFCFTQNKTAEFTIFLNADSVSPIYYALTRNYCVARLKLVISLVNPRSVQSRMDLPKPVWTLNSVTIKS